MKRTLHALGVLVVLAAVAAPGSAATTPASKRAARHEPAARPAAARADSLPSAGAGSEFERNILYINGVPDTAGVFLDDSILLARVDDRRITAREFVDTYYNAYAEDRPGQDSLGR